MLTRMTRMARMLTHMLTRMDSLARWLAYYTHSQTTLIAGTGNEPFQKMVTCSHLLDVVVSKTQIQTKKNWFHGQVAAQGGWTVYSKREITYTSWSDIPFH